MAGPEPKILMSQAEFARRRGVSKKTVTEWKGKGLLAMTADGKVDVEASEWSLDQRPATYRGGTAHRPIRAVPKTEPDSRETQPERANPKPSRPAAPQLPEGGEGKGLEFDPENPNLPLSAAVQRKENWLGLARRQDVLFKDRKLVDRAAAEAAFFKEARGIRDAWIAWPARVAIEMADELKIDARTLSQVLAAYVQQHLAELGEPTDLDLGQHR
jgi:hypothetical protein